MMIVHYYLMRLLLLLQKMLSNEYWRDETAVVVFVDSYQTPIEYQVMVVVHRLGEQLDQYQVQDQPMNVIACGDQQHVLAPNEPNVNAIALDVQEDLVVVVVDCQPILAAVKYDEAVLMMIVIQLLMMILAIDFPVTDQQVH